MNINDNYFESPTREEQELSRRIRRRDTIEAVGVMIALAFLVLLVYLCMAITPPQMSAECDFAASLMENSK